MSLFRKSILIPLAVAIFCAMSLCAISGVVVYLRNRPGNQVEIFVKSLPQDLYYASIVADTETGLKNMHWLAADRWAGGRYPLHPKEANLSIHDFGPRPIDGDTFVRWEWGNRYTVW